MRLSLFQLPRGCVAVVLSIVCLAALPAAAETYTWSKTAAGTYAWPDPDNWGGDGFPNATNDVANLNIDIVGNINVQLNTNVSVGVLNIGDDSGTSVVKLQHGTGTRTVTFAQTLAARLEPMTASKM